MFLRKVAILLLVLAVILGGITAYLAYERDWRLFSDPAAPRSNPDYERLMAVSKTTELPEPKETPGTVIESSDTELIIREPGGLMTVTPIYPASEIYHAAGTNAIPVGTGTVSLGCIGVSYAAPRTNFDYAINIPARFYSPDLHPLSLHDLPGIFRAWQWNTNVEFRGQFPAAKFVFTRTNLSDFKFIGAQLFDARTKYNLMRSYSRSGEQEAFWFEGEIGLWHQAPLELVLTIATGPAETYAIPPKTNETIRYPGGWLKLIGIVDGPVRGMSSLHDGKTNRVTLRKQTTPRSQFDPQCAFVFASLPGISDPPIDIDFLNEEGKIIDTRGGSYSARINLISLAEPVERVKEIRLKYYSKVARLIFQIPELPGLPVENRNLKNLFDARIPYIRFQQEWDVITGLNRLTQTGPSTFNTLNQTNTYYPLIFTNVTTRELFLDVSQLLPSQEDRLTVDPIKNTIEIAHPPLAVLLEKLRKLMR
jgi:hypothetical protein